MYFFMCIILYSLYIVLLTGKEALHSVTFYPTFDAISTTSTYELLRSPQTIGQVAKTIFGILKLYAHCLHLVHYVWCV